jgi:plasmid stabilization system protein ParE
MNKYTLKVESPALRHINDAFNWYEDQREGLGTAFQEYVYDAFDHLAQAPFIYAPYRTHYRKMPLRRFPYSVIYQVMEAEQTVIVIAVLHQKRDSKVLFEE